VNLWFVFVPAHLLASGRATALAALGPAVAGLLTCTLLAPLTGALSDSWGRRPVLVAACVGLVVLWPTVLDRVLLGTGQLAPVMVSPVIGAVLSGFVLASHLPESFATRDRALGIGLTYGVGSAVFGGLAPLVAQRLATNGRLDVVAVYPVCCSVLAAASLAWTSRRPDVAAPAAVAS
jgi:MFS transporter, MHS family, proline/betaine transporter